MKSFIIAGIAAVAAAATLSDEATDIAADIEDLIQDTHDFWEDEPLGHTGNTSSWENWVGKYKYAGATDGWLDAMWRADHDRDGAVTLSEALVAAEAIGGQPKPWVYEVAETVEDDYRWDHDMDLLMELIPLGFDHDGDYELDLQETTDFFHAINKDAEEAEEVFFAEAQLSYDDLFSLLTDFRFDSEDSGLVSEQLDLDTYLGELLSLADANGDGVVSLREVVEYMNAMNQRSEIDVDRFVAEHGEDYDWVQDLSILTDVLTSGYDIGNYEEFYAFWDDLDMPWVTDQMFDTEDPEGASHDDFTDFLEHMQGMRHSDDAMDDFFKPDEDWVPLEERFSETFKEFFDDIMWESYYRPDFFNLVDGGVYSEAWTWDDADYYTDLYADIMVDFEYWNNPIILAGLMIPELDGYDTAPHLEYEVCYDFFEKIGFPWILDTNWGAMDIGETGAGWNMITGFVTAWMLDSDSWETSPPEGWTPMEDRLVPIYAWENHGETEEMEVVVVDYLHDEIRAAIARLEDLQEEVEFGEVHDLGWTEDCEDQMEDLSELIFDTIDWATEHCDSDGNCEVDFEDWMEV